MSRVRHGICHGGHVHWCPRNKCSRRHSASDTISHVWRRASKIHWCSNSWDSNRLPDTWCTIHANPWGPTRRLFGRFPRARGAYYRTICLTGDRPLDCRNFSIVDTGDVVDAWSPSVLVHWIQTYEVLLCMACHLSRCSRYHKVSWYTSPITFPIFFQT